MSLSLLDAAAEAPGRTALVTGGRSLTYGELAERVRRILPELRQRTAEAPWAALIGDTDLPTLERLYGLIELGRPVVLLHPRWSRRERERLLEACAPTVELGSGWREIPAEACLAVVATSGSSGRPKGALLSRRAFIAAAEASAANLGWTEDDRWLLSLPVAHVGGLSILTRCLLARRTVVVHRAERFDPLDVAAVVDEHRVTLLSLVPTMLRRLLALEPAWNPPPYLRAILLGGAAASPSLLAAAADRGWPVLTTYGMTEACSQVATQAYGTVQRGELGCGRPLGGTEVRIVDGAIEIRGPQLMSGYLPPASEDPFTPDRWFRTQDLGRLDDAGRLHVLGRRDAVIVSGGENVLAGEVEEALEEHPAIAEACVFAVEDDEWGQAVAAALVASSERPSDQDVRDWLRGRLAAFKMPRRIFWVDRLERLASGKLDRRRTAERLRASAGHESLGP